MTIQEYMYRRFRAGGMNATGACATLGQVAHEGAFRSNNAEDSKGVNDAEYTAKVDNGQISRYQFMYDGIGYGYAQWTWSTRKGLMYDFHKARQKSIGDSDTQIDFLLWEMEHYYPNQWKLVTTGDDLKTVTWELLDKWENPDEKTHNMEVRYADAQKYYREFSGLEIGENEQMDTNEAIEKVLNLARNEIGYHEKASNSQLDDKTANSGSGNWTKYARELDALGNFYNGGKNGYAWCDVFYDWLFVKCFGSEIGRQMLCQPLQSAGAGCLYSVQYYKQYGRWYTSNPQPGDQIFFSYTAGEYSHTGLVESVSGGVVNTIEGNTSDQVGRRSYAIGSGTIAGYGRPRWDLVQGTAGNIVSEIPVSTTTTRILKIGSSGDDVKELQENLISLGYDLGSWGADGDFGNDTVKAVRQFQTEYCVYPIDGEVGDDTRAAIEKALKEKQSEQESLSEQTSEQKSETEDQEQVPRSTLSLREIKMGDEGYDVKLAQAALQCWGYITLVSGIFGKELDEKIRDFQTKKALEVSGVITRETWKKLLEIG